MANTKSAKKRIRVSERNRLRNKHYRSRMKTYIKKAKLAIEQAESEEVALQTFQEAMRIIQKTAQKGVIHKNRASRIINRLNRMLKRRFQPDWVK